MMGAEKRVSDERFDGFDPQESIGAFDGSGQWVELCTVADLRALRRSGGVAVKGGWRYDIQYGPEGEAIYAWVYDARGDMVCTAKVHHAKAIVDALSPAPEGEYTHADGLRRVREIAIQSETAPLCMGEIIKVVDMALGEQTPVPEWIGAQVASPPEPVEVTEEMVERAFNATWDCPHEITGSAVTLRADPAKPGNALSQLRRRLTAALAVGQQPTHRHKKRGMEEVAIYRSIDDGSLWVRPREEFEGGRLETLGDQP